jgi:hypothetical protein
MIRASSPDHDLGTVRRVLWFLAGAGINCWLFGGWAEELRGLCAARFHTDVDLLCMAEDFAAVDALLLAQELPEIKAKRFRHKRAFVFEGVMVELFLVEHDARGAFTLFWGETRYGWPADTFSDWLDLPVASVSALGDYRRRHDSLVQSQPEPMHNDSADSSSKSPRQATPKRPYSP